MVRVSVVVTDWEGNGTSRMQEDLGRLLSIAEVPLPYLPDTLLRKNPS
jgi:hypothetical protein